MSAKESMSIASTGPVATADCQAVREILDRVGDTWSLYIVGALRGGPQRFNGLKRSVEGISQRMLTLTLRGLERDGLVTRTVDPLAPVRVFYELTELGHTLLEPVLALVVWVERHASTIQTARTAFDGASERAQHPNVSAVVRHGVRVLPVQDRR